MEGEGLLYGRLLGQGGNFLVPTHTDQPYTAQLDVEGCLHGICLHRHSQEMTRRRAEVALRPLPLNRSTPEEMLPSRGTLFLKVIKGTQLVQRSQLPQQRERKLQARFSAFLGGPDAGPVMHAVSVTSWLMDADDDLEAQASTYGDDDRSLREGRAAEATFADTSSSSASSREAGFTGFEANAAEGWTPSADAARTSTQFIAHDDTEGAASWEEEFFFERVFGETAVRIVCVDKSLRAGVEDELVGQLLIPVSRLPQNTPVEQWYSLEPPVGSGKTFTRAALLLRFHFTATSSPVDDDASMTHAPSAGLGASDGDQFPASTRRAEDTRRQLFGGEAFGATETSAAEGGDGGSGSRGPGSPAESFHDQPARLVGVGAAKLRERDAVDERLETGVGRGSELVGDPSLDPFMDDDVALGQPEFFRRESSSLLSTQQLQLGGWNSTSMGTLHAGAAAAEAALALSIDAVLPSGLVDYFLVVGPAADEEGKLQIANYADCGFGSSGTVPPAKDAPEVSSLPATAVEVESAVLEHFPEQQREDAAFPTKVEWFCFPQGLFLQSAVSRPTPHMSSFVRFTSGVRSYGICLTFYREVSVSSGPAEGRVSSFFARGERGGIRERRQRGRRRELLWCPLCLCVLTHVPVLDGLMHWLQVFHWCLMGLEREGGIRGSRGSGPTALDAAVFQLTLEVPLPVPGVCAMSVQAFGKRFKACPKPEFALPGLGELPPMSFPLGLLLRSLRPKGLLQLFAAILQEGRILLHSTKPALLAAVAEGVFALMYPLQWPYAYVPVLPNCLIEHVESPQPFILGVHTDWLTGIAPDALKELIIVDCDLGSVEGPPGVEPLPAPVRRSLTKAVRAVLHGNLGNLDAPVRLSKPSGGATADRGVGGAKHDPKALEVVGREVTVGGGCNAGEGEEGRRVQRGRMRGMQARMEALLRQEFARAMADMLYGFTECLFFLQPERPIFNSVRFLQEYCEEEYVPFMSIVVDTQAFKYLLETQDSPPLRPFREMLDKARRDAFKREGGRRKDLAGGAQASVATDEMSSVSAFDGPFPVVKDSLSMLLERTPGSNAFVRRASHEEEAGGCSACVAEPLQPPVFFIPAPSLESFVLKKENGDKREEEEIDFTASRGKGDHVFGGLGTGGRGNGTGEGGGRDSGAQEMEQAPEEGRQESVVESGVGAAGSDAGSVSGSGPVRKSSRALSAGEGRSSVRLSDARGGFIVGTGMGPKGRNGSSGGVDADGGFFSSPTGAGKGGYDVEADEIADDGDEERSRGGRNRNRRHGRVVEVECYDSAGEWASDGSDGLPAVLAVRKPAKNDGVRSTEIPMDGEVFVGGLEVEMESASRALGNTAQGAGGSMLERNVDGVFPGIVMKEGKTAVEAAVFSSRGKTEENDAAEEKERPRRESGSSRSVSVRDRVLALSSAIEKQSLQNSDRSLSGSGRSLSGKPAPAPPLRKFSSSEGRVVDSSKANPTKGDDEVEEREELGGDEDDSVTAKEVPPDEQRGSFLRPAFADCGGAGARAVAVGAVEAGNSEGRVSRREIGGIKGVPLPHAVGNSLHGAKSSDDLSSIDSSLSGLLRSVRDHRGGNSGSNTSGSTVDVGVGGGMYDDGYSQPVMAPLSSVEWSHEEVLRLGRCELPQPREWTLADIGKEIEEDLGKALREQTAGSHGSYSVKTGAGLAAAAVSAAAAAASTGGAGANEGGDLDPDSEKLLRCLEAVYSSDRVSEEMVVTVEETLKSNPAVQRVFLQVLRHAGRRGYASRRRFTLLHGPSFETLARFSYTLLCVCVNRADYSTAHTLLQLTGAYFQVHEGDGEVFSKHTSGSPLPGGPGNGNVSDGESRYFSEVLSARISKHSIFTDMKFWQHVLKEAVQAKTEKLAKDRSSLVSGGVKDHADSLPSSPGSSEVDSIKASPRLDSDVEVNRDFEFKDPALASETVFRQVKVFLYEMASIGMRSKTAQRYVDAVSLQYKLPQAAKNGLQETVRRVWGAGASLPGTVSPPFSGQRTPEALAAHSGWSRAKVDAADLAPRDVQTSPQNPSKTIAAGTGASVTSPNVGGESSSGGTGVGSGRQISSSSSFSAGTQSKVQGLRLSPSELASQLQAESSPSPRMATSPASGAMGRFRSPSTTPQGSIGNLGGEPQKPLSSATLSPNSGAGGRERGVTATLSSASSIMSPGVKPRQYVSESTTADPPLSGLSGRGRSVHGGGVAAGGTVQGPLSPPRPLVADASRSRAGLTDSEMATGTQEPVSSPGPRAGGTSRRRFFFGADTMRSLASSLSTPDFERSFAPPGAASKLPVEPAADKDNNVSRSRGGRAGSRQTRSLSRDSSGGERGWAEIFSGEKGELPSLLAPLDLQARDGEGVGHQGPILCLSSFESRACAGSTDCSVSVYDLNMASRIGILSGHTGPVTSVACGDDWVLSGSSDCSIRLWQNGADNASNTPPPRRGFISLGWQAPASTAAFKAKILSGHEGPITTLSAHPRCVEGRPWLAVSGGEDSQIRMWDLRTRRCKVIFTGHSKAVTCLTELKEDGSHLILSGSKDGTVRLWDINETKGCKALRKFSGHEGSVGSIIKFGAFLAASCSNDRTVRTWDHRVKGAVGVLKGHRGPVTCVQQTTTRTILASGSADGAVMVWDLRAAARGPTQTLRGHQDRVTGLLASGGSIYSSSEDASLLEWTWETGELKSRFFSSRRRGAGSGGLRSRDTGGGGGISCLAATGDAVLTAGWDKTVRMWPRSFRAPKSEEGLAAAAAAAAASAGVPASRGRGRGGGKRR